MKKKMILSVAAAAALLMANPTGNQADAASNCPTSVQTKVVYYQSGEHQIKNMDQVLQKYLSKYNIKWDSTTVNQLKQKQVTIKEKPVQKPAPEVVKEKPVQKPAPEVVKEKPVQKPAPEVVKEKPVQKPAPVQKPVQETVKPTEQAQTPVSSQVSAFEQKVVELTNAERAKSGLKGLQLDVNLSKVAREKSKDMASKNYFSHTSPTYGSPFDMMKQFGISYRTAGENIAMGQTSPEEVVKAWMNSEGHRKNILNGEFTHIGVGHVSNGNYWTQMFIGK